MSTKKEFRFAAGSKQAKKSSVWSVKVSGSDIYLFSSLFGGKQKVSLHDGGHAQWSMTQEWVAENPGMKNQKRHIAKWQYERPNGVVAACIFRVRIPQSQLVEYDASTIRKKVMWASGLISGCYNFDFYLTMPLATDPTIGRPNLPENKLKSMQLSDGRWLVIFLRTDAFDEVVIGQGQAEAIGWARADLDALPPNERKIYVALFGNDSNGVRFIMETHCDLSQSS